MRLCLHNVSHTYVDYTWPTATVGSWKIQRNSEVFSLREFTQLWSSGAVGKISLYQCKLGLMSPEGLPLYKQSMIWANSKLLLEPFEGLVCSCEVHGSLEGNIQCVHRTRLAQTWPAGMCNQLIQGILSVVRQRRRSQGGNLRLLCNAEPVYPARIYPREAIFDCLACESRRHKYDVRHTRNDSPPQLCRCWDIFAAVYECPA